MADIRFRGAHRAAVSLSGVSVAEFTLGGGRWFIQAGIISGATKRLFYRYSGATGTACTIIIADGFLSDGGTLELNVPPGATEYINVLLTDAAGTASNGGASDYIYLSSEQI